MRKSKVRNPGPKSKVQSPRFKVEKSEVQDQKWETTASAVSILNNIRPGLSTLDLGLSTLDFRPWTSDFRILELRSCFPRAGHSVLPTPTACALLPARTFPSFFKTSAQPATPPTEATMLR